MTSMKLYAWAISAELSLILSFIMDFEPQVRMIGMLAGAVVAILTAIKLVFDIAKRWHEWKDKRLEQKLREEGIKKSIEDRYR